MAKDPMPVLSATDDPAEAAEALAALLAPILASPDAGAFIALVNRKLADLDPASATVWRFFLSSGMPPDKQ